MSQWVSHLETYLAFIDKNINFSACSRDNEDRWSVITLLAQLKIHPLGTLVPRIHKYFIANFANVGNSESNIFHHCKGLQFKPTLGNGKYFSSSTWFKSCMEFVSTGRLERFPKNAANPIIF